MTPTAPTRPRPLSRRLRRVWADAPFVVQALLIAALFFTWLSLLDLGRPTEDPGSLLLRAVVAALVGVLAIGSRRIRRLSWPGAPREVEVSEATEDGALPPGADVVAWRAALERRGREIRQEAWAMPILLALLVALAFLPRVRPFGPADAVYLAFLVLFAAYAVGLIVSRPRRRDRVDALLIPLQEQARRDDEERAGWAPPAPDDRIPPAAG
jgi:hypothetical protein